MIATATTKLSKTGRAALWYAVEKGWRVFPLHSADGARCSCGAAQCGGVGKHPRTSRGCLDASSDPATIRAWWTEHPDANVGIATGAGLVVIDVDPRHGGDDALVDLRRTLGDLPDTVECLTGGGGRHIYLSLPDGCDVRNSASQLGPGIDVRGSGGYVVATPSTHESGRCYGWEASSRPEQVDVAPMPDTWLAALLKRPKLRVLPGGAGEVIPEGQRNEVLFKRAASMRSAGFERNEIEAALQEIGANRCVPAMDPAEVKALVASVCRYPAGLSPEYQAAKDAAAKLAAAKPADPSGDWEQDLYRTARGAVRNTLANLCTILRRAPEYAGRWSFDLMARCPCLDGIPLTDSAANAAREAIERAYAVTFASEALWAAVGVVADERQVHPVREYLRAHTWDGTPRLDRVALEILGAQTPLEALFVRRWLISTAARALRPGCKCDTALVLVGKQAALKSTFFATLAGTWFCDTAADITDKDAFLQLASAWIIEWAEFERVTSRRGADEIKAFLSSREDRYRPPYGRAQITVPRACVIVGSTNQSTFLDDETGSRRFWPVAVAERVDIETLTLWRDQLWAEAVARLDAGERWWLDAGEDAERHEAAAQYAVEDPWAVTVARWLASQERHDHTAGEILTGALDVPKKDHTKSLAMRLSKIMRALGGWERRSGRPVRSGKTGEPTWLWVDTNSADPVGCPPDPDDGYTPA